MLRSAVLVTGMSGTGKSAVLDELARRGHAVVDTDDPGWIVPDGPEPLWDLDRVRALLSGHREGRLFVAGCVANQGVAYDLFDEVVLLSAPLDVLLARVAHRENPFGSTPQDRAEISADVAEHEPLLRRGADREIVTTVPVGEVATALEQLPVHPRRTARGRHGGEPLQELRATGRRLVRRLLRGGGGLRRRR